jgi:hypothetical protein
MSKQKQTTDWLDEIPTEEPKQETSNMLAVLPDVQGICKLTEVNHAQIATRLIDSLTDHMSKADTYFAVRHLLDIMEMAKDKLEAMPDLMDAAIERAEGSMAGIIESTAWRIQIRKHLEFHDSQLTQWEFEADKLKKMIAAQKKLLEASLDPSKVKEAKPPTQVIQVSFKGTKRKTAYDLYKSS